MSKTRHQQVEEPNQHETHQWMTLMDTKRHRQEKRLKAALKRKNVKELFEIEDRDYDS